MKVLIDTNVILDVAIQRQPHVENSTEVLAAVEAQKIQGFVSASTFSDIYYISRKSIGHLGTMEFLNGLTSFCKVATVGETVIHEALLATSQDNSFKDFEDAIQHYTAKLNGLDVIVTRNARDFQLSDLQVLTPEQLIRHLKLTV